MRQKIILNGYERWADFSKYPSLWIYPTETAKNGIPVDVLYDGETISSPVLEESEKLQLLEYLKTYKMKSLIENIYRVEYMKNNFSYVGTLRNEKKFNIEDVVFFAINGNEIACGKIIGVERTVSDNPDYIYKIQVPKELVTFNKGEVTELKCDRIFSSVDEAKESALQNLFKMSKLQRDQIEKYFEGLGAKSIIYPNLKQVGEIIDILYNHWSHFGNKESLVQHFGEYDNHGEKQADAIFNIIFTKATDINSKVRVVFWKHGIQVFETDIKKETTKVVGNTNGFALHSYLIKNNLLGFK